MMRRIRCGSMRRSARMRTCSPIWCDGCWRTAPTPASCIAWSIRRCRKRRSSPIRWRGCARSDRCAGEGRHSRRSAQRRCSSAHRPDLLRRGGLYAVPRNPRIPLPRDLRPDRVNSAGVDLADRAAMPRFGRHCPRADATGRAKSAIPPIAAGWSARSTMRSGGDRRGTRRARAWLARRGTRPAAPHRAAVLERAADLIEASREELLFLLAREGGKTLADGIAEIREAADYCRWYALRARERFRRAARTAGPTGERNTWASAAAACSRHLAVELPAGDLHRPGRRRARRRQCGRRQARRTDAVGRGARRGTAASRRACRVGAAHCCLATERSARRW